MDTSSSSDAGKITSGTTEDHQKAIMAVSGAAEVHSEPQQQMARLSIPEDEPNELESKLLSIFEADMIDTNPDHEGHECHLSNLIPFNDRACTSCHWRMRGAQVKLGLTWCDFLDVIYSGKQFRVLAPPNYDTIVTFDDKYEDMFEAIKAMVKRETLDDVNGVVPKGLDDALDGYTDFNPRQFYTDRHTPCTLMAISTGEDEWPEVFLKVTDALLAWVENEIELHEKAAEGVAERKALWAAEQDKKVKEFQAACADRRIKKRQQRIAEFNEYKQKQELHM